MHTLTTIAEGITATKGAMDVVKSVLDLCRHPEVDVQVIQRQLIELSGLIVNTQVSLSAALVENQELRNRLDDREALEAIKNDMEHVSDGGFSARRSEREQGIFKPYCPVCLGHGKAIPLVPKASGYYSCVIHPDATYKTTAYRAAEKKQEADRINRFKTVDTNRYSGPNGWMTR
jgi:hypothetical protein